MKTVVPLQSINQIVQRIQNVRSFLFRLPSIVLQGYYVDSATNICHKTDGLVLTPDAGYEPFNSEAVFKWKSPDALTVGSFALRLLSDSHSDLRVCRHGSEFRLFASNSGAGSIHSLFSSALHASSHCPSDEIAVVSVAAFSPSDRNRLETDAGDLLGSLEAISFFVRFHRTSLTVGFLGPHHRVYPGARARTLEVRPHSP